MDDFIFCFTVILLLQCIRARAFLAKHGALLVLTIATWRTGAVSHPFVYGPSGGGQRSVLVTWAGLMNGSRTAA